MELEFEDQRLPGFKENMGVSKNNGTPKSSILRGFSIIFTIHFGVPLFLETCISGRCRMTFVETLRPRPLERFCGLCNAIRVGRQLEKVGTERQKK